MRESRLTLALIKQPEFLTSDSMPVSTRFAGVNAVLDAGLLKVEEQGVSHHSVVKCRYEDHHYSGEIDEC